MTSDRSAEFFNNFAEKFDTFYEDQRGWFMRWVDKTFRYDMYVRFQMTFDKFGDLNGKRVLDVGCGSGIYALECCQRGALSVTGVDPAPNMIRLAKTRLKDRNHEDQCHWINGAFPDVQLEPHEHVIVMGVMDQYGHNPLF